jgi:hypothetical protein
MAHDLLLGTTRRDWSCGIDLYLTQDRRREMAQDILSDREVGELGKLVDDEIQQSYREIVRLNTSQKIPADLRRSFRPLLARWQEFSGPRQGKFAGSDYVALVNFRDENRQFAQKLATISATAPQSSSEKSPTVLAEKSIAPHTTPPRPPQEPWVSPTTIALAVGGVASLALLISAIKK